LSDGPPVDDTGLQIGKIDGVGVTLMIEIVVEQSRQLAVIDTAAQISMIGLHVVKELNIDISTYEAVKLKNAEDGAYMNCFFTAKL
jgi:hypothetical protein